MNRRHFIHISAGSFLALISTPLWFGDKLLGVLFKKTRPREVLDKIAFVETVYPLFTFGQLLKDADTLLEPKRLWAAIDTTFFSHYYKQHNRAFNKQSLISRENRIQTFLDDSDRTSPAVKERFDKARNDLILHMVKHSYFMLSAYGYPDKPTIPFCADPSWDEYHLKPRHL